MLCFPEKTKNAAVALSMPIQSRIFSPFRRHGFVVLGWGLWAMLWASGHELGPTDAPLFLAAISALIFVVMLGCVFAVVHHADRLAEILREPCGTLVLTLSATIIEASLMLAVMLQGEQNPTLLRDTIFATLMIVLNGMVGMSLLAGGWVNYEQEFNLRGAVSFLHLIAPLSLMLLVFPNYTQSSPGPTLAPKQEAFLGLLCLLVYALFLWIQTGRHRSYFDHLSEATDGNRPASLESAPVDPHRAPERRGLAAATLGLLLALLPVVLLAEHLGAAIDLAIERTRAPAALGGVVIASLVLFPEALGAYRAALADRMQRAVNICLGSALATIGLTIPTILVAASLQEHFLILGIDGINPTLLYASLFIALLTFSSGRSNVLQGLVHLMLFATYLFFSLVP